MNTRLLLLLLLLCSPTFGDGTRAAIVAKDGEAAAELFDDAVAVNIRPALRAKLAPIVAAIRYAENGRAGREYGVLHPRAKGKSYRTQAGWCAATVQKHWDRYTKAGGKPADLAAFLESLARRYCPVGAGNDPTGLNKHWLRNVSAFRDKFTAPPAPRPAPRG